MLLEFSGASRVPRWNYMVHKRALFSGQEIRRCQKPARNPNRALSDGYSKKREKSLEPHKAEMFRAS